nr:HPP family protein [Qipengyuania algicida]
MGASAVLVFAVPASPLAQPWPLIGGNLLSTAIGLGFGQYLGSPLLATSFGVGTAIAVMSLARCLHPPGGACALLCALGATGSEAWGWDHMLPIVFNVIVIALAGWLYNNLTGHSWPHKAKLSPAVRTSPDIPSTHEALEEVLAEWNEVLDVDVDDLDALFQALRRRINLRNSKKAE